MLSQTVEYALRAVVFLASSEGEARTAQEVAERMRVPPDYLSKILRSLVEAGLLRSRRGPQGGFVLGRDAAALSVLDVVNAVDPIRRIHACPLDLPAHARTLCPLHRRLDEAAAIVEGSLRGSRISEMVGDLREATEPAPPRGGPGKPLPVVRSPSSGGRGRPRNR